MYYPKPNAEYFLPEEDGHKIYYAEYGNPKGLAVISVHGGPGSGSRPNHATRMDLDTYRVILFDQRACGKSEYDEPFKENTTQKLASDMERIREELGIDSWVVTGGSWGSALSLFYAQNYADKVEAILINSIFLGDQMSLDWFGGPVGVSYLYTDVWDHKNNRLQNKAGKPFSAKEICKKLHSLDDQDEELRSLVADVLNWEGNLFSANRDVTYLRAEDVSEENITYAKVFMHYESNHFFMEDNLLLDNMSTISHIPMAIIHGRHDVLCPFKRAWDIYKAHDNAEIVALPQSNHAFSADGDVARKYFFQNFLKKHSL